MTVRILSIGTANPPGRLSQAQSIALARALSPKTIPEGLIEILHRRSGIQERAAAIVDPATGEQTLYKLDGPPNGPGTADRLALYTQHAAALSKQSSLIALERANIEPSRITHIITASCTGFEAPGIDQLLVTSLNLRRNVSRTHIGFMGCHAAVNCLAVARSIAAADASAIILICCVELSSIHMHFSDRPDQLVANALFADGAATTILSQSKDATLPELRACSSWLFADSESSMSWKIGDHGFEMKLAQDVPDQLTRNVPHWLDTILDSCQLNRSQIQGWAIHPGGPKIVEGLAKALSLPEGATDDSLGVLRAHGNMSSATVLFILDAMMRRSLSRPWVGMAFGPGLAAEAVVLT